MKYLILLSDGMADYPVPELNGLTPLEAAHTPAMDSLAEEGRCGTLKTLPAGMPAGSAVANLSVLGYDPRRYFTGRGALEAASMGVHVEAGDLIMRLNLICVDGERIRNHSAGHISTSEASRILHDLRETFKKRGVASHTGVSYRHVMVIPGGSDQVKCVPPHDVVGERYETVLPTASSSAGQETADLLRNLIQDSRRILEDHPVNKQRKIEGKDPANCVWPWSLGYRPDMPAYFTRYHLRGAVISAVDLLKGIAVYAGMDVVDVEGATGLYTTNYEGKADAAVAALKDHDFVYVHVEASDEAGHEQDAALKKTTIEYFDRRLVRRIIAKIDLEHTAVAVLPDHYTPVSVGTHTSEPVPLLIRCPGNTPDSCTAYTERHAARGGLGALSLPDWPGIFLGKRE